jgi:hypothetical protein
VVLGNKFIERATLIGNAVENFESEGILLRLGAVVNVRSIFTPHGLKPSTHSGLQTQLAPRFPDVTKKFLSPRVSPYQLIAYVRK